MGYALTRELNQQIIIAGNIVITLTKIERNRVQLVIDAPRDMNIDRAEKPRDILPFPTPLGSRMKPRAA